MSGKNSLVVAATAAALVGLWGAPLAQAQSPERGRMLYENHCTGCHDSVAHTRTSHKATNSAEVNAQVARWARELKLDWNTREIGDVSSYVSAQFYKFGATPSRQ